MQAGMLRVLLCRHGETHDNVARLTQGHAPGALTQTGRAQAAALAARLATTPHDAVYCSDLRRAVETLRIVADAAQPPHPPATLLPLLRERGAGVFEGAPLGTVDAAAVAAGATARSYRPDGGESWQDVRERAAAALQLLATQHLPAAQGEPASVLVVSHGGFIREFVAAAAERAAPPVPGQPVVAGRQRAGNTAVYTFHVERAAANPGRWHASLVAANDTAHLDGLLSAQHETE